MLNITPLEFLALSEKSQSSNFKLQISSNDPIPKNAKLLTKNLGHCDIGYYLITGPWNLVIA
jgi:hypothetical protein